MGNEAEGIFSKFMAMRESNMLFQYYGAINTDVISALLQLIEGKLTEISAPTRRKKNLLNILIEGLQNIYYHGTHHLVTNDANKQLDNSATHITTNQLSILPVTKTVTSCCYIGIKQSEATYYIEMGNYISADAASVLGRKLQMYKQLDTEALQKLYLETLNNGQISPKGGAGLGVLRMIREAGAPIQYSLIPYIGLEGNGIWAGYWYFSLLVTVPLAEDLT